MKAGDAVSYLKYLRDVHGIALPSDAETCLHQWDESSIHIKQYLSLTSRVALIRQHLCREYPKQTATWRVLNKMGVPTDG